MTHSSKSKKAKPTTDALKRRRLKVARGLALALLGAAGLLYIAARHFMGAYPWLGFVAAFSQAAMIGALADWFAIVALFRHPFGIPLPHTAIITTNKARIAHNLGEFIQARFLTTDKVIEGIRAFGPARRLAKWLGREENITQLKDYLMKALTMFVALIEQEGARQAITERLTSYLETLDGASLLSGALQTLSEHGQHQWLLDEVLAQLDRFLQHEDVRDELVRAIARHLNWAPSIWSIDERLGRVFVQALYEGLQNIISDARDNHDHALRHRFDETVTDVATKLAHDPTLRARAELMQAEFLRHVETQKAITSLWSTLQHWIAGRLQDPNDEISEQLTRGLRSLTLSFLNNPRLQASLDAQLLVYAPALVEKYRRTVGLFIAAQVKNWNDSFLVDQIELNIGRDLQFIRINGTLVGGFVGLLIYAAGHFLR